MAELDPKTKLQFSHRGRAFATLIRALLPTLPCNLIAQTHR
jgi:inosine/xanthosine triphosphate pyrophosphatase family protein